MTDRDHASIPLEEATSSLPAVALIFPIDSFRTFVTVTSGDLDDVAGRESGIFFRLNDNRRGLAQILQVSPGEIIGQAVLYGRITSDAEEGLEVLPIEYHREAGHKHHTAYGQTVIEIERRYIEEGVVQIAHLGADALTDLEGNTKDYEDKSYFRHPATSFTAGPSHFGPK